jgi:DNA invertase Pin-like site-specific DNA recombinase
VPPLHPPSNGAPKTGRAAAYARVSTPEQGFELQRVSVERRASNEGAGELTWFTEQRSGRSWIRPELDRLLEAVRQGRFDRVYVWRLDRLTRRGSHDTLGVVQAIRSAGAELVSVTEGFDFTGAVGELLISMLGFAAKLEMDSQMERQQAARARLESEGRAWGRPAKLPAEVREKIRALRAEDPPRSIRSIAMAVKVPRSSVFDALKP